MRAIYQYTFKKYMKSYSTWVIMAFSAIVIGFIIGGMFPFVFLDLSKRNIAINYVRSIIGAVAGITVFFAIFSAVFAGFKSAQMYRDEVENGTFLVIISKPMRRSTIIFGKWFALQSVLLIYALVSVLCMCIGVAIFDNGEKIPELSSIGVKTLRSQIWYVGIFIFLILYLAALIFSSIGLILSTKLSSGATLGITIAIGVYIPISGLISMFVRKPEAIPISNSPAMLTTLSSSVKNEVNSNPAIAAMYPNLNLGIDRLSTTVASRELYNKAITTDDHDKYGNAWWFDVDYQFKLLSAFAYEKAIPSAISNSIIARAGGFSMYTPQEIKVKSLANAQHLFDDIKEFVVDFQAIGDDVSELAVYKFLFGLQPITAHDVLAFFTQPSGAALLKPQAIGQIKSWLGNKVISDIELSDFLLFCTAHPEFFVQTPHQTAMQFINAMALRPLATYGSLVNDDYYFKVPTDRLAQMDKAIKQHQVFNNQGNHTDSVELTQLISDLQRVMTDPAYAIPNTTTSRYVDFATLREVLNILYLKSRQAHATNGSLLAFPIRDLTSLRIKDNVDGQYDETWLRSQILDLSLPNYLADQFRVDNDKSSAQDVATMQSTLSTVANPLSMLLYNNEVDSFSTNQDLVNRGMLDLRKTFDDKTFDINNPYVDPVRDALSNLSPRDTNFFTEIISGAIDRKVASYTARPYATKEAVFAVYAAIAIALVPLAFVLIRRQDFR